MGLGLGVDDAFVLASEYKRASKNNPKMSIEDRVALACKYGGMSILITSATDALAFLVGSATVLPALSWFCQFSGIGVIFCFTFQITIFLPCLVLNARREETTRLDCCCCIKTERDNTLSNEDTALAKGLKKFANMITSTTGTVMTLLMFAAFLAVGILGMTKIYKDFK